MVGQWLANGCPMVGQWLANGWPMVGQLMAFQWLANAANGWPMVGQWQANGWRMVGEWLANGWPVVGQFLVNVYGLLNYRYLDLNCCWCMHDDIDLWRHGPRTIAAMKSLILSLITGADLGKNDLFLLEDCFWETVSWKTVFVKLSLENCFWKIVVGK